LTGSPKHRTGKLPLTGSRLAHAFKRPGQARAGWTCVLCWGL